MFVLLQSLVLFTNSHVRKFLDSYTNTVDLKLTNLDLIYVQTFSFDRRGKTKTLITVLP